MSLSTDDRNRRRFMRRALALLPVAGMAGTLTVSGQARASESRERSDALDMTARNNILYWGADPSGQRDSAPAFIRAARSSIVNSLYVPPGRYAIGQTVDLKGKNLIGPGRQRFRNEGNALLMPFHSLGEGVMFTGHGPVVRDLNFASGRKKGRWNGTYIEGPGYNTVIENVHFASGGFGIHVRGIMVNYNLLRCTFIGMGVGVQVDDEKGNNSTTARFVGNEFNYSDNGIIFEKNVYGATFQDNIFEAMKGDAIRARLIYRSSFIGNWWEGRNKGKAPWPCVRTTESQQFMNCFASSNTCVYGWTNVFKDDSHSGGMGGVSLDGGEVLVRNSTGNALRLSPSSIRAEADAWKEATPLVIQSSHSDKTRQTNPIVFRHSGPEGDVVFDTDRDTKNKGVWDGALRFASQIDGDDRLLYDDYRVNRGRPGVIGETSLIDKKGTVRHALTGISQFVKWRKSGDGPGCDFFSRCEAVDKGQVEFSFPDGEVELRDPIITVTVEDAGIVHDGIEYLAAYSGSSKYQAWKGFRVRFVERKSGQPTLPESFSLSIFHPR
ncbi:hypothetical protein GCM10010082_23830 [Kushneria pakistanensis]|uniref:Right handed beta helix domain-containing protein n=1 Tax=Kushneria pakistanensis TaxID=1508770 RepID=A0ABQ3FLQ7_9GAMM|nr:hypothetical protein [Kushneria pakistanensis]GHC29350.1 hypothetical protein GCM10010082_23830 [Kushneria pakistanensis]